MLSIARDIYKSFDKGYEVREVMLVISKAFDKVCHNGILFKLNKTESTEIFLRIFKRWDAYGCTDGTSFQFGICYWRSTKGVFSGRSLFLIFINEKSNGFSSIAKLFADGISLFSFRHDINATTDELNNGWPKISS